MRNTLKKLANSLGLTKRTRRELSDIIEEDTVVVNRFKEEGLYIPFPEQYTRLSEPRLEDYQTNYFVVLKGSRTFEINDEFLYRIAHAGDQVRLSYRDVYEIVSDYAGGDFSMKAEIERRRVGFRVESADKI